MDKRILAKLVIGCFLILSVGVSYGWDACPPTAVLVADPNPIAPGDECTLDGSGSTDCGQDITRYDWDFTNNGSYDYYETASYHPDDTFDGITTHTYNTAGSYTCRLKVWDEHGAVDSTYVVNVGRVKNDTRGKWYADIPSAINATSTVSGDELWVLKGTYTLSSTINVNKAVKIYGGFDWTETQLSDRDWVGNETIIQGSSGIKCLNITASATIDGFTIKSGDYGMYCTSGLPVIGNNKINLNSSAGIYSSSTTGPTIKNNLIYDNGKGIELSSATSAGLIENNTIIDNTNDGIRKSSGTDPTIKNCILWGNGDDLYGCSATYSCIKDGDDCGTNGNICSDPLFANATGDDFHLKSAAGHWNDSTESWVADNSDSLCIDAGGNSSSYSNEPLPNGGIINLGAYGNTQYASKAWGTRDELAKLLASDGAAGDLFGQVSISGDYAIIGAYHDDDNGTDSGSAYIFKWNGSSWTQQAKLTASDGAEGDDFGISVSISGDYAIVGAQADDDNGTSTGSAYIFNRDGTSWNQQAKLVGSDCDEWDWSGNIVAIDGDYALVGASGQAGKKGAVYVFKRDGTSWSQQAKLTASDGEALDSFGYGLAIDGDYVAIGAKRWDPPIIWEDTGRVYIFKRNGTSWTEEDQIDGCYSCTDAYFGNVSISGDYLAVGAQGYYGNTGCVYMFKRSGSSWQQEAYLEAPDGDQSDLFGYTVSTNGNYLVIGAADDDNGTNAGSAYVYVRQGTTWALQSKLIASDAAAGGGFLKVAISGNNVFVGASADDNTNGVNAGSVYIFEAAWP